MEENKQSIQQSAESVAETQEAKETQEAQEIKKQTTTELFWEIFRFLLVGGTATVCDYIVFWLLDGVLLPTLPFTGAAWSLLALWIATACGFVVGLIVNWILSSKFVLEENAEVESGQYAVVKIWTVGTENVLTIPVNALYRDQKGYYVYKIIDGERVRCDIKEGLVSEVKAEILEGLEEGDVVYVKE